MAVGQKGELLGLLIRHINYSYRVSNQSSLKPVQDGKLGLSKKKKKHPFHLFTFIISLNPTMIVAEPCYGHLDVNIKAHECTIRQSLYSLRLQRY